MKTNLLLMAGMLGFVACTAEKEPSTIHLKGQFVEEPNAEVVLAYDGASSMLGKLRNFSIKTDAEGKFDTIISIKEPGYYRISRNTLYLSPGDDLTMKITSDNEEAEFQGKGAEANNYMKSRLFPKAGSYLEAGKQLRANFEETKLLVDSLADIRRKELSALTNVSAEFKDMEEARIHADVINSYMFYPAYARITKGIKDKDEARRIYDEFMRGLTPMVTEAVKKFNNDCYMDVAVVRDVMSKAVGYSEYNWTNGIELTPMITELFESVKMGGILMRNTSPEIVDSVKTYITTLKNKEFADELNLMIKNASKLLPGQPAIDIELQDIEGNILKLSDFKGKVLYIDFWATWCGPCKAESPYFESLAKEYTGKDIVFIPVSIDAKPKLWKDYLDGNKKELKQYYSNDGAVRNGWEVKYIPSFLIIDKNFNIVSAKAPRPSEAEVIKAILDKEIAK